MTKKGKTKGREKDKNCYLKFKNERDFSNELSLIVVRMQLESITSFIQCNILIPLFLSQSLYRAQSHMNAMPTPFVLHTPSILSILIADAKPIMRSLIMAPVWVRYFFLER